MNRPKKIYDHSDIKGKRFGKWKVVGFRRDVGTKVMCLCECGRMKWVKRWDLSKGNSRSCNMCSRSDALNNLKDIQGFLIKKRISKKFVNGVTGNPIYRAYFLLTCPYCKKEFEKLNQGKKARELYKTTCPYCQNKQANTPNKEKKLQMTFLHSGLGYSDEEIRTMMGGKEEPEPEPETEYLELPEKGAELQPKDVFEVLSGISSFIKAAENGLSKKCPFNYAKNLEEGLLYWNNKTKRITFTLAEIEKPLIEWKLSRRVEVFNYLPEFMEECINSQLNDNQIKLAKQTMDKLIKIIYFTDDKNKLKGV